MQPGSLLLCKVKLRLGRGKALGTEKRAVLGSVLCYGPEASCRAGDLLP
jgi:hypothetical protein